MIPSADLPRFLRARRVAVLAIPRDGRAPLATPIWYDYDGERFRIQIEATSAKAKLLGRRDATPVSLVVQSEVPPYRYAIVYGSASLRAAADPDLRRRVARRYFGRVAGDQYVAQEDASGRGVEAQRIIEITPERIVSHDFRPEAGWFGRLYFGIYRWFRPVPA
jgi:nitroimidazol reductase NimA-like FMN-containing flavoprotein (pyridoxamine 5'-phosphate oxidase superfamily)